MERKNMNFEFHPEGDVNQEMKELLKVRDESVYIYSVVTNTCSPFLSIMCC